MSGQRYTPEFKDEAVKLITERGYSVTSVAERLGVSQHSIYKWLKAVQPLRNNPDEHELLEAALLHKPISKGLFHNIILK